MDSLRRFFTPLSYLRIKRDGKLVDEVITPTALTIATFFVLYLSSWTIPVFGPNGIITGVTSYLQIVSGFYIASLAAIATFNKDTMDKPMAGEPPLLRVRRRGKILQERLTRRRFLCFLFGYLALLSIGLYFVGIGANLIAPALKLSALTNLASPAKWAFVIFYIFCGYNLMCTTLLGLYFMTDRIHRVESEFSEEQETIHVNKNSSD